MKILALDISRRGTGWTVDGGSGPTFGTFRIPDGTFLGRCGVLFANWLSDMIAVHRPDLIGYEAPAVGGGNQGLYTTQEKATLLIGMAFMAATLASTNGIQSAPANVQTIRKHFLGQGRPADPKAAVSRQCQILGWAVKNSDEADAAALWAYLKATRDKSFRLETATPLYAGAAA